ncbi:hypothetical protein KI688_012996 [Linnemannia hyalina]|uniref:Blue (type 1) copper domain-containing protein n=1 Tax=Linnemannia hyalina TaxID=64524 RepID=A0A9P7XUX7_9FUNG|nr:hypothetical protein KI688_012996 [Linnemannia hyalina]
MYIFYAISILAILLAQVFAAVHVVTIKDFKFVPQVVNINPGDKVTWTNNDSADHTATADAGSFDSGLIATGKSFSHTFTTAATLSYHCTIHPYMLGTVKAAS